MTVVQDSKLFLTYQKKLYTFQIMDLYIFASWLKNNQKMVKSKIKLSIGESQASLKFWRH